MDIAAARARVLAAREEGVYGAKHVEQDCSQEKRMRTQAPADTTRIHIHAVCPLVRVHGGTTSSACGPTTDTNEWADSAVLVAGSARRYPCRVHFFLRLCLCGSSVYYSVIVSLLLISSLALSSCSFKTPATEPRFRLAVTETHGCQL